MNNSKIYLIILFLTTQVALNAQSNFSMSMGMGTTHYLGSIAQSENMSINSNIGGYYKFNNIFSTGLLYNHIYLKATRLDSNDTPTNYFNTTSNNLSLHLQFNIMELFSAPEQSYIGNYGAENRNNKKFSKRLRIALDFGPGIMFYNTQSYLRQNGEMIPDTIHNNKGGNYTGMAIIFHLGGEVGYEVYDNIELFANFYGNVALSSEIDGYNYANKSNQPNNTLANDYYYTTTIGLRYAISSKRHTGNLHQYKSHKSGSQRVLPSGFTQYKGFKNARDSYDSHRR